MVLQLFTLYFLTAWGRSLPAFHFCTVSLFADSLFRIFALGWLAALRAGHDFVGCFVLCLERDSIPGWGEWSRSFVGFGRGLCFVSSCLVWTLLNRRLGILPNSAWSKKNSGLDSDANVELT